MDFNSPKCSNFYKRAADYWSQIPPTLDGVLGGFGFISKIDIECSKYFIEDLFSLKHPPSRKLALDCGAGIGRITKDLLINAFEKVDMIEQNPAFLKEAEKIIEPKSKLGNLYPIGLQDFTTDQKYDVIWCQWVLGHLTDKDLIQFFNVCVDSLADNGVIIVKENVTSSGQLEKDDIDSSVTRSLQHLLSLFKKSHLSIVKEHKQNNFPKGIYPVYIFALRHADIVNKESDLVITDSLKENCDSNQINSQSETKSLDNEYEKIIKELQSIDIK